MKAIVVSGHGEADVLTMQEIERPVPHGRQVLLKVLACGVCRRDIIIRKGPAQRGNVSPLVLGHEIAGEVVALGPDARNFKPGDRVCSTQREYVCGCCSMCRSEKEALCPDLRFLGQNAMGGYAEYTLVNDDNLALIPAGVDDATAAIVACAVGTSYNAVCDTGQVRAGECILISGMGGLGIHAIQIARAAGAFVIASTRTAAKVQSLKDLGAHAVVVAEDGKFSRGVREAAGGQGVDIVVDTVGGAVFQEVLRAIKLGGRIVLVGEVTGQPVEITMAAIYRRGLEIRSATSTSRRQLETVLRLVASGQVRPIVDRTMPLADAAIAHRMVEDNAVTGRIVLIP